jgi:hypothetical protein
VDDNGRLEHDPGSRSVSVHTLSGTHSQHTCSRMATTSEPCRSCSGTRTSARRWSTRTCSIAVRSACTAPSTGFDVTDRGWPRTLASNRGAGPFAGSCELFDPQDVVRCGVVAAVRHRPRSRAMRPQATNHVSVRSSAYVLRSAPTRTYVRSTSIELSRMDVSGVVGLLHK